MNYDEIRVYYDDNFWERHEFTAVFPNLINTQTRWIDISHQIWQWNSSNLVTVHCAYKFSNDWTQLTSKAVQQTNQTTSGITINTAVDPTTRVRIHKIIGVKKQN